MRRALRGLLFGWLLLPLIVGAASAHGDRTVGPYTVVFGWRVEPAYAGLPNGPEIILSLGGDDAPFPLDIEVDLRADVSFGPATKRVFFAWDRGTPGRYSTELIPTMPGDYVFHITGAVGDTQVDLTFDSADGEFSSVEPLGDILFPVPDMDTAAKIAELEERLAALEARLAVLEGQ